MARSRREHVLDLLRRSMSELDERFGVSTLWLFGSSARQQDSPASDVDLVVSFRGPPSFDQYMDLRYRLEELLDCRVDLITASSMKPRLAERVRREGVRVA